MVVKKKSKNEILEALKLKKPETKASVTPQSMAPQGMPNLADVIAADKAAKRSDDRTKVIRDEETGGRTGVEIGGSTFFLPPKDINAVLQQQQQKGVTPLEAGNVAIERQKAELLPQVGQLDPNILAQVQKGTLDIGQVMGAGVGGAILGKVGGRALGGAGAAALGVGAVAGGALTAAAVGVALIGIRSSIKKQQQEKITAGKQSLTDGTKNLNELVGLVKADPQNSAEYVRLFNEQLSYIERDFGILKLDTQGFLSSISGEKGVPEIAEFQRFYDGDRRLIIQNMNLALLSPVA